MRVSLLQRSR